LQYDHSLAKAVFMTGSAIMALSLLWAGLVLIKRYKDIKRSC